MADSTTVKKVDGDTSTTTGWHLTDNSNPDSWVYYNPNGTKATNQWVQDSKGWVYMDGSGNWQKNGYAKDSTGQNAGINSQGYWNGGYVAPDYNTEVASKLTLPTYKAYKPTASMSDMISQAEDLMAPSLQRNINNIKDQTAEDIQNAKLDMARRGVLRGSYFGARTDSLNRTRDKNLESAALDNQIAVNNMASANYQNAWQQGYQLNKDLNDWNQNIYGLQSNNLNNAFNAATNSYNSFMDNQWNQKKYDYQVAQDAIQNQQWQKEYDEKVREYNNDYALSLKKSNGSGGSGSGSKTNTKEDIISAYNEGMNSNMPATGEWLTENQDAIIKAGGVSLWNQLETDFEKKYGRPVGTPTTTKQSNAYNDMIKNAWTGSRKVQSSSGSQI